MCLGLSFGQGRQQHAREDGDDGNNHQQLDEGETAALGLVGRVFRFHFNEHKINGRYWTAGWARTIDDCAQVSYSPFCTIQKS